MEAQNIGPEEIFNVAVEIRDPREREAYLNKVCGNDKELRAEVDALLNAHEEAGSFMNGPALGADVTLDTAPLTEGPGTIIGRYKLLERIGEGGFGVVYMAEQQEPIRRKVALKIIKLGMDTKQVIARFEAERQALAMMDHPSIAKVLDAGATETGRPYFVMELVKGIPITEYCDKDNLDTRQRLALFADVCKAVQHAHQKGIIHRDIKPSNVMVTLRDGKPVPKVIDFGIAKATSHRLTEKTLFTKYAQMIGTPEYMSPEQAEMSALDIDTRTDIYSLGVLLYELLTGVTPFDAKQLREAGYAEIQRIIRETEPLKPSTKLSTMGDALNNVAKHRQTNPDLLPKLVRGDLDWIVMKSLEKDRTRRYETANELAADITRHLGDEPVSAGPPSVKYRLRKFVRRNRALVTGVAAVLAVLVAGVAVSTIFAVGQARARARAEFHAAMLHGMMESFQSRFFMKSADNTVGEAVETCAKNLELLELREELSDSSPKNFYGVPLPLMVATSHLGLGNMYAGLEKYEKAEPHLEQAYQFFQKELGWKHEVTRHAMNDLAVLYLRQGRYDKAEPLLAKALKASRRIKGDYHDEMLCYSMSDLGQRYIKEHRYNEAEPVLVKAMEISRRVLGEQHENTLWAMTTLGWLYSEQGRYNEAEPPLVKALEIQHRVRGEKHASTLYSMNLLGDLYTRQGRYEEAEALLVNALEGRRRTLGEEHEQTLWSMGALSWLYLKQRRYDKAEALYVKELETSRRIWGEEHLLTTDSMDGLGELYTRQGRYEEAEPLLVKSLENIRRMKGEENRYTPYHLDSLGRLYTKQGRYNEAEPLLVRAVEVRRRLFGEECPWLLESTNNLAVLYREQSRYSEAESLFVKALEVRRRVLGDEHPDTLESMSDLALLYLKQGRYDEAEPLGISCYQGRSAKFGPEHAFTQDAIAVLAKLYEAWGKPEKAEQWRAKLPHKEGTTER